MKQFVRAVVFSFFALVCSPIFAQVDENDLLQNLKYNRRGELSGIYYSDKTPDWTCRKGYENLRLVRIRYSDDDNAEEIGGLLFSDSKGRREVYVFGLNFTDFSTAHASHLRYFIAQGNWYRVGSFRCGAGGASDPSIFSLELIPSRRRRN
jgi:hypothetical protein